MDKDVLQKLLEQLWFQSDNCVAPIENAWFLIQETSKITGTKRQVVRQYFDKLIELKLIQKISDEPLLFQFTEIGKQIKSSSDVEKYVA
jgi:hypothetical protein